MELLSGRSNACALCLSGGLLFVTFFMLDLFVVQGQEPVIFQYSNLAMWNGLSLEVPGAPNASISPIDANNITCLGDLMSNITDQSILSFGPQLFMNGTSGNASGKCLYKTPVQLTQNGCSLTSFGSFGTMFEVYITPGLASIEPILNSTLQGLAFIIGNDDSSQGAGGGYLGWLNSATNDQASGHNFAVEIDFFQDQVFDDPAGLHVGVDKNSLTSSTTYKIDVLKSLEVLPPFTSDPSIPNNTNPYDIFLTVWADFDAPTHNLSVYVSWYTDPFSDRFDFAGIYNAAEAEKPLEPSISTTVDLSDLFSAEGMFVGFSASGQGAYFIRTWTFNSNGPAPDVPRDASGKPFNRAAEIAEAAADAAERAADTAAEIAAENAKKRQREIVAATVPSVIVSVVLGFTFTVLYRQTTTQNARLTALAKKYQIEEALLDQGPQKLGYRDLARATKEFNFKTKLGEGGFGSVYKGSLALKKGDSFTDVAIKRISATSKQGEREFLAEVKIIGQAQHRNLVRLLGWCHEKGELLLVYDYMPNGSVYDHLYKKTSGGPVLTWTRRMMILSGVAKALTFLHEEWEHRVIHRDVKSSNVMLDHNFNARLGDFGLARLSDHDKTIPFTEAMAGTYGYIAPELHHTYTPSEKTDVYSFGATMLEIATGKKPLLSQEDKESLNQALLVDWVWGLYRDNALLEAADPALNNAYDPGEMEMFLKIALLSSHPNPDERPHMREVINIWKGSSPLPQLPLSKPVPVFAPFDCDGHSSLSIVLEDQGDTLLLEKQQERRKRFPDSTLRYRHTTSSLPF